MVKTDHHKTPQNENQSSRDTAEGVFLYKYIKYCKTAPLSWLFCENTGHFKDAYYYVYVGFSAAWLQTGNDSPFGIARNRSTHTPLEYKLPHRTTCKTWSPVSLLALSNSRRLDTRVTFASPDRSWTRATSWWSCPDGTEGSCWDRTASSTSTIAREISWWRRDTSLPRWDGPLSASTDAVKFVKLRTTCSPAGWQCCTH